MESMKLAISLACAAREYYPLAAHYYGEDKEVLNYFIESSRFEVYGFNNRNLTVYAIRYKGEEK